MKTIKIFEKEIVTHHKGLILSDTKENVIIVLDDNKIKTKEEKIKIINKLLNSSNSYWSDESL